jgi:glycosyltransferase involved in cell wall biosynthesis
VSPAASPAERDLRVLLYGQINMNLIDGSSVWLASVAQMLTTLPGVEVTLLLRYPAERELLTAPLAAHPRIELAPAPTGPDGAPLSPRQAVDELERLDSERPFDVVLLRGTEVAERAASQGAFAGRLWVYYLPPHDFVPGTQLDHLRLLGEGCARILCQTEPIRALAEAAIPEHAEKLILLPPMIPGPGPDEIDAAGSPERSEEEPFRMIYAGKIAPEYYFLEMVEILGRLRVTRPEAELAVIGDKVHDPPENPAFRPAAEAALSGTEGLVWLGGVPRERVAELLAEADVALSIRHPEMARSRELSTKVLEYGAAGCAVLLNRTPLYEALLGADYPLFATDPGEALAALDRAAGDPALRKRAAAACAAATERHTFERVAAGLERYLRAHAPAASAGDGPRLLFAGHDLKFLAQIPGHTRAAGAEVREDPWQAHDRHSVRNSRRMLRWAQVVMCEWCLGNAVWYSEHLAPEQRLVIRYHRMERETDYPERVRIERVDHVAFVGRHLLEEAAERFSWPEQKLRVVPNSVDVGALRRDKLPGSEFNLAVLGFVPARKRLDRALDVLEVLRARDRRYRLIVKGRPPWDYDWIMRREEERVHYALLYGRLERSPLLRDAVSFEQFSPNVPAFLRKVGILLSTADHEGHQVALAEAMASGCLPVVLDRAGAREQYGERWVHDSPTEAAASVLALAESGALGAEQRRAAEYAERWSVERIMPLWDELLGLAAAPDRVADGVPA